MTATVFSMSAMSIGSKRSTISARCTPPSRNRSFDDLFDEEGNPVLDAEALKKIFELDTYSG
jgi:hypothetical protein